MSSEQKSLKEFFFEFQPKQNKKKQVTGPSKCLILVAKGRKLREQEAMEGAIMAIRMESFFCIFGDWFQ